MLVSIMSIVILGKEAKIARFEGLDYITQLPEVMDLTQMKNVGDEIGADGTSAQKVVGLHMRVNDIDHLKKVMEDVEKHFHFYDAAGNDLTINFNREIL